MPFSPLYYVRLTFGDPAANPKSWPQGILGKSGVHVRYGLGQTPIR